MDLEKIISLPTNRKILRFFSENPHCVDTAQGIASWTGVKPEIIKQSLKRLVKAKIIIEHKTSSTQGYSFTNNKTIINAIKCWFMKHENG